MLEGQLLNFPNASGLWRQPGSREQVALTQEGSEKRLPTEGDGLRRRFCERRKGFKFVGSVWLERPQFSVIRDQSTCESAKAPHFSL